MDSHRFHPRMLLCTLVFTLGCAPGSTVPAKVSGKISYNGKAVGAGQLLFHTAEGTAYPGLISRDGSYTAIDLPTGKMTVTVETESINPAKKKDSASKDAGRRMAMQQQQQVGADTSDAEGKHYIKIPDKYASVKSTTLNVTLSAGNQTYNIDLTD